MRTVDTVLKARWIIPVEPPNAVLEDHALVIDQHRIVDILPIIAAADRYDARSSLELGAHALIPGLINAHTHAAMSLLRGL
ncbi:MAG TPA: TRZ/ATZ family hydrolase, partial [Gammaproteobacteria bacterium]|nr:TRZ/ATZ family hydrolase [Gammaproteobacteria bacterium]